MADAIVQGVQNFYVFAGWIMSYAIGEWLVSHD